MSQCLPGTPPPQGLATRPPPMCAHFICCPDHQACLNTSVLVRFPTMCVVSEKQRQAVRALREKEKEEREKAKQAAAEEKERRKQEALAAKRWVGCVRPAGWC